MLKQFCLSALCMNNLVLLSNELNYPENTFFLCIQLLFGCTCFIMSFMTFGPCYDRDLLKLERDAVHLFSRLQLCIHSFVMFLPLFLYHQQNSGKRLFRPYTLVELDDLNKNEKCLLLIGSIFGLYMIALLINYDLFILCELFKAVLNGCKSIEKTKCHKKWKKPKPTKVRIIYCRDELFYQEIDKTMKIKSHLRHCKHDVEPTT